MRSVLKIYPVPVQFKADDEAKFNGVFSYFLRIQITHSKSNWQPGNASGLGTLWLQVSFEHPRCKIAKTNNKRVYVCSSFEQFCCRLEREQKCSLTENQTFFLPTQIVRSFLFNTTAIALKTVNGVTCVDFCALPFSTQTKKREVKTLFFFGRGGPKKTKWQVKAMLFEIPFLSNGTI